MKDLVSLGLTPVFRLIERSAKVGAFGLPSL